MGGRAAEAEYRRLFRTYCLLSPHRKGSLFGPSKVWDLFVGDIVKNMGIGPDIGLLFDDLFLALSHPSPSIIWYTQTLALRDSLFSHWMDNPRTHTRCSTIVLVVLCNVLAIMEIRLLSLRDGSGRTTACKLTAALPTKWKELLGWPAKALHPNRIPVVLQFMQLQLQGTVGSLPHENHMVYLMLAGCNPYVGRAIVKRQRSHMG